METLSAKQTPEQITTLVERLRQIWPDFPPRLEEDLKLSFHFDGQFVAMRRVEPELEILASGTREQVNSKLHELGVRGTDECPIVLRNPQSFRELYMSLRLRCGSQKGKKDAGMTC